MEVKKEKIGSAKILDATCGSKMMWFDKNHPDVIFTDKRKGSFEAYGNKTVIAPDINLAVECLNSNNISHVTISSKPLKVIKHYR